MVDRGNLRRYAWLSIAAAIVTVVLRVGAASVTGSVSLLSDALESGVNLLAAVLALGALSVAARPPDEEHIFGHSKIESVAAAVEGLLIIGAAFLVGWQAIQRLFDPQPLETVPLGLAIAGVAALLNLVVSRVLQRAGEVHRSETLKAESLHLRADVWTSGAVIVGILGVVLTGWEWLDPVVALAVAVHVLVSGGRLLRGALNGLMDVSLPADELAEVEEILDRYVNNDIDYHALRTRTAGALRFVSFHLQVPGSWSVTAGHQLAEYIEQDIRRALYPVTVFTHLEPAGDPVSLEDVDLIREESRPLEPAN